MSDENREPLVNPAQSKTPGMPGNSMRENRETPPASGSSRSDRLEKAISHEPSMHVGGESDEQVVPTKQPNNGERSSAEVAEGSCSTKGNTEEATHAPDTEPGTRVPGTRRCAGSSPQG